MELLEKVSPRTKTLKRWIKSPMILLLNTSALLSGNSAITLKLMGEIVQSGTFKEHIFLFICMAAMLIASAGMQVHVVNVAMKYYD